MIALDPLELQENGAPIERVLDAAVGRALQRSDAVKATLIDPPSGLWSIEPKNKIGVVTVAVPRADTSISIFIRPKLPIRRLMFLLDYIVKPRGWRDDPIDVVEHEEFVPAVAHFFERQIGNALRPGLLRGFRPRREAAMVVRGRIDTGEQLRCHFGLPTPIEVEYDEHTADIAENRVLLAAIERMLRRLSDTSPAIHARLRRHRERLIGEVTPPAVADRVLGTWTPNRLNLRYLPALRLAEIILRDGSVEQDNGEVRIDGFLFTMWRIFEDFVTVALERCLLGSSGSVKLQDDRHHLDAARTVLLRPDLIWYDTSGKPLAVVDAKYKAEKRSGFPNSDLYQVLAYCTVLGLREGHLVYAKGNETRAEHLVRGPVSEVRIHQHALDLERSPVALLAQIKAIAERCIAQAAANP